MLVSLHLMSDRLDQLLEQLLGHARPRTDGLDEKLMLPHQPEPWLVQRPETLLTLALGVELIAALKRHGGTSLSQSLIDEVRQRLRQRFDRNRWRHLEEELVHVITWLEHALTTGGEAVAAGEDPALLSFDPEPRRLLALEAIDRVQDLYLEVLDLAALRYRRLRVRPEFIDARPPTLGEASDAPVACLVGARVPEGDTVALPLARIRWVMAVKRLSDLPDEPRMGDVVRFPTRLRERDDEQ